MDFALPLLGDNPSHPSASPPRGESRGEMGGGGGGGRLHRPPPPPFLTGLWQEFSQVTLKNKKSCGRSTDLRTVWARGILSNRCRTQPLLPRAIDER